MQRLSVCSSRPLGLTDTRMFSRKLTETIVCQQALHTILRRRLTKKGTRDLQTKADVRLIMEVEPFETPNNLEYILYFVFIAFCNLLSERIR